MRRGRGGYSSPGADAGPSLKTEKQIEYIRMLEERNRLKKAVEAKSDRTLKRDELERGFNLHFHAPPGEEQARRLPGTLANPAASLIDS